MVTATPAPSFLATGRDKLTLALLTAIGFLDFADASIVNIALADIRQDLHFSVQDLQWVLNRHDLSSNAMTAGFQRALVGGLFVLAATAFGLRTRNSRGEHGAEPTVVEPEPAAVAGPT